ncbi:Flp pilus assembly protein CpaB [Sulfitobacter sp. D35]|uniref:Flp pilus assembly protein CpaB n=1 Tax=Sulfitobacter sp. D35 TaxID=3083252 RepID=UPI00296ECF49|nr:Flp pilus assembly protein CpaB [Sulfitobacter sp. D35]MDW4499970.1 Flp pilus assembly protein CpaB [Sulfitobacter sp. D35]
MRLGSFVMAIAGLSVAGGSVYAVRNYISAQAMQVQDANASVVRVLAAAHDIPFGHAIEGHMLTTIEWPASSVPPGAFTDRAEVLGQTGGEPRRAKARLAQGELLLSTKLSEFGEKVTIVQTLGANTRAMAIKVDAETAVGGFVTPGDYVDVLLTQGRDSEIRAVTILQNIRVVGVDQSSDEQSDETAIARTVTVEVTPGEGQRLALAQKAGTLSLSLRTLEGAVDEPLESVRLADLMREVSPVPETEKRRTVRVRRGTGDVQFVEVE